MVLLILLLALLLGGVGLFVETLWWMLIIAGALALVGFFFGAGSGYGGRSRWRGW
jgi:energy-coupling factor transporter transmembrane protein EcfT